MKKSTVKLLVTLTVTLLGIMLAVTAVAACTHNYGDPVNTDNKYHTLTCKICGAKMTEHHGASCKDKTTCEICGATGVTCEIYHENEEWKGDEICHWKVCSDCGEKTMEETIHTVGTDGSCTVCGKTGLSQKVTKITVPSELALEIGSGAKPSVSLNAAVYPSNAADRTLSYMSEDLTVARVSADGVVTAVGEGDCMIIVKAKDGSGTENGTLVSVTLKEVTSVKLDKTKATLHPGDTLQLVGTVVPEDSYYGAEWTSSKKSVATVDQNGLVTAVSAGTATIRLTALDLGGEEATCKITVSDDKVESITLNTYGKTLNLREDDPVTFTLIPTVYPIDALNREVSFASSDSSVVTVDANGVVTAVGPGSATVRVKAKDGSGVTATCSVTVKIIQMTAITLSNDTLELEMSANGGASATLSAQIAPKNASNPAIVWESDDPSVADVDQNGVVTAYGAGTCEIICYADEDPSVESAPCKVTVTNKKVEKVALNQTAVTLHMQDGTPAVAYLSATVSPTDAVDQRIKWSSSDTTVATVDSKGIVTGVGNGTCKITAKSRDGSAVKAKCTVTVTNGKADSVTVTPATKTLTLKNGVEPTFQATAKIEPDSAASEKIVWYSTDDKVATVSENGLVTAVGKGSCKICAAIEDGGIVGYCEVTCKTVQVKEIQLNESACTMILLKDRTVQRQLKAGVSPTNAWKTKVSWTSSDPKVVKIDKNGVMTALKRGTATITAKATDGSGVKAKCVVTVKNTEITSLTVTPASKTLTLKDGTKVTTKMKVTYKPTGATDTRVKWSSSNTAIATVDSDGVVTAKAPGSVTITGKARDGSGKKASATVTVKCVYVTGITLSAKAKTLELGEGDAPTFTLKATVKPTSPSYPKLSWTSSDESVATVDSNGKVTAIGFGTCVIKATATDGSGKSASCTVTVKTSK